MKTMQRAGFDTDFWWASPDRRAGKVPDGLRRPHSTRAQTQCLTPPLGHTACVSIHAAAALVILP
jgi:hypothetical protein